MPRCVRPSMRWRPTLHAWALHCKRWPSSAWLGALGTASWLQDLAAPSSGRMPAICIEKRWHVHQLRRNQQAQQANGRRCEGGSLGQQSLEQQINEDSEHCCLSMTSLNWHVV